jgi:hypothetical protein
VDVEESNQSLSSYYPGKAQEITVGRGARAKKAHPLYIHTILELTLRE